MIALLAGVGCRRDAAAPPPESGSPATKEAEQRGRRAVGALKQRLMGALTEAMKAGGGASAIGVCNVEAPAIAEALRVDGVQVGRATRKPRNPANVATGWQAEALSRFETMARSGESLDGATWARRLPDGRTAYAEPIVIQPLCVTCHGEVLGAELGDAVRATYPGDRATGYRVGDLRGVAWAEIVGP